MFELSPQDWTAVQLSLRSRQCRRWSHCHSASQSRRCWPADFWGKALVDGIVLLPLVLPPVVTGYLLLITLADGRDRAFLADHFGIVFSFRWTGAALACGVMAFPLMVRVIRFDRSNRHRLEDAASTLGATQSGPLQPSRCRWRCPASLPVRFWRLPARSVNSAQRSRSFQHSRRNADDFRRNHTLTQVPNGDADAISWSSSPSSYHLAR